MIATIQAKARQMIYQDAYARTKELLVFLQCVSRGFLARLESLRRRWRIAAQRIQSAARMRRVYKGFCVKKSAAIQIQMFRRNLINRRNMKYFASTAKAQARYRGVAQRKKVEKMKKGALLIQCAIRGMLARKRLKKMRKLKAAPVQQGCKGCVMS